MFKQNVEFNNHTFKDYKCIEKHWLKNIFLLLNW